MRDGLQATRVGQINQEAYSHLALVCLNMCVATRQAWQQTKSSWWRFWLLWRTCVRWAQGRTTPGTRSCAAAGAWSLQPRRRAGRHCSPGRVVVPCHVKYFVELVIPTGLDLMLHSMQWCIVKWKMLSNSQVAGSCGSDISTNHVVHLLYLATSRLSTADSAPELRVSAV